MKKHLDNFGDRKIHILFEFVDGPWGGGNQFLKSLKNEFVRMGIYEEVAEKADVILLNSHHQIEEVKKIKQMFPTKIFLHRIDGPISLTRGNDEQTDKLIFDLNNSIADISIFQSIWSFTKTLKLGFIPLNPFVITNASDPNIFNTVDKEKKSEGDKFSLISTSWSSNSKKGLEVYKWLDDNLDFDKITYKFVGNIDYKFKNIELIPPVKSEKLAEYLKESDIFITASKDDPCSNSLIEALSCGLPALYLESGGHFEIVKEGGLGFTTNEELKSSLDIVMQNYDLFRSKVVVPTISDIAKRYLLTINSVI